MAEPITVRTGLPGHGKTLNAIIELDKQAHEQDRPVYYCNLEGLQPDKLKANWFEFTDALTWYELPESSIIVIDEAQRFFPVRDPRTPAPRAITQLETIRHGGREITFITQNASLLDVNIRRLAGCHIYFKRVFGTRRVSRYEFPKVVDTDKVMQLRDGNLKIIKLDSRYFNTYNSAVSHHFKAKIPKKLYFFIGCIFLIIYLFYSVFANFNKKESTDIKNPEAPAITNPLSSLGANVDTANTTHLTDKDKAMTVNEYLTYNKPRLKDYPASAPRYDELNKPVSMPKPSCISSTDKERILRAKIFGKETIYYNNEGAYLCQCYSQQGTKLAISGESCLLYVENGYFDDTKPDGYRSAGLTDGKDKKQGILDNLNTQG